MSKIVHKQLIELSDAELEAESGGCTGGNGGNGGVFNFSNFTSNGGAGGYRRQPMRLSRARRADIRDSPLAACRT